MKIGIAVVLVFGLSSFASVENPLASQSRRASSLKALQEVSSASIGLALGQQAPAFSLPDQFGHQQSNETLKGSNGTVLLFFRSADW